VSLPFFPPTKSGFRGVPQDQQPEVTAEFLRTHFPFLNVFSDLPELFDWKQPVDALWYTIEVWKSRVQKKVRV
jgi:hypothetical protein